MRNLLRVVLGSVLMTGALVLAGCHPAAEPSSPPSPPTVETTPISAAPAPAATPAEPVATTEPDLNDGQPQVLPAIPIRVGKAQMQVEITSTSGEREKGLMFRRDLPDNEGMSFALPIGHASFWMKNTLIPLSVAFLDRDGTILEIHDMKALDTSIVNSNSDQIAYALEANLHWFALNGVKPGDKLDPAPAAWAHPVAP